MYRVYLRSSILTSFFLRDHVYDIPPVDDEYQLEREDDPIVRVKSIFQVNKHSELSPQLISIITATTFATLGGLAVGGIRLAVPNIQKFIDENQATKFESHIQAKRQLQHRFMSKFVEGGIEWARKLGLFAFVFSTVTNMSMAYNGQMSAIDYTIGGAVSGLLFKATLGLRAAIVGGIVGGVLGTVAGNIIVLWFYLLGMTIYDSHIRQHKFFKERQKRIDTIPEVEKDEIHRLYDFNQKIRVKETQLTQGKVDETKQA